MGSEAPSSNTPILDLIKPLPTGKTNLVSVVLAILFGSLFGIFLVSAMGAKDNGLLLFLPVLFVVVTIHEFGHAVAGHLVGFQLQGMSIGPVCVSNEIGRWKFRLRGPRDVLGLTLMSVKRIGRLRRRYAWMVVAGPLSNLVTGAVALVLGQLLPGDESSQFAKIFLLFALVSFWAGLSSLLPFKGRTYNSDGKRLQMLLCSSIKTRRFLSLLAINSLLRRLPPKQWNQRWIRSAIAIADESPDCFRANWFAYLSANDRKEEQLAAQYLDDA